MSDKSTGVPTTKRQQIDNTRQQMFIVTAMAAGAIVVCLMVGWNLITRIIYQNRVNDELGNTNQIMHANVDNIDRLIANIDNLKADKNLNLTNIRNNDESAIQVILDSLPTEDNRLALSASLKDKILASSGVHIESINVTQNDDSSGDTESAMTNLAQGGSGGVAATSSIYTTADKIPFATTFSGSSNLIQQAFQAMENSIRPIHIDTFSINIDDTGYTADVNAHTYFSKPVQYKLDTATVSSGSNGGEGAQE